MYVASSYLRYKIYMCALCLKQSPIPASRPAQWQASCFFYLDVRSIQPTTKCNKQASRYQARVCQQSENHHVHNTYMCNYDNTVTTIPCTSSNLTCGYIAGIYFCLQTKKCQVKLSQSIRILQILSHILYANNVITFAVDNFYMDMLRIWCHHVMWNVYMD